MKKKERDNAKEEARVTRLAAVATGDTRAKLKSDLARVKDALATAEEANAVAVEVSESTGVDVFFSYGYGCYVFKHNICGDHPKVPKGMPDSANPQPPEFFMDLRYPLVQATAEATAIEVPLNKAAKEPMEITVVEDHGRL